MRKGDNHLGNSCSISGGTTSGSIGSIGVSGTVFLVLVLLRVSNVESTTGNRDTSGLYSAAHGLGR